MGSSPLARGGRDSPSDLVAESGLIPARAGRTQPRSAAPRVARAHPRSRGADCQATFERGRHTGSSPLARGGRGRPVDGDPARGLIPARAGRTRSPRPLAASARAHPRSRGADTRSAVRLRRMTGSSPLARGGRAVGQPDLLLTGLIPARAGRTRRRGPCSPSRRAHPRSRGADFLIDFAALLCPGSSPLARGGHLLGLDDRGHPGLIPARAGRTRRSTIPSGVLRAHPRSRGADSPLTSPCVWVWGSSPLARGGHHDRCPSAARPGLIPARAGRTARAALPAPRGRAHPRSRGADAAVYVAFGTHAGSSPLARGGHGDDAGADPLPGLIPARAGRTRRAISVSWLAWAHPRSRGGHVSSSARGPVRGLIPARAGRTTRR